MLARFAMPVLSLSRPPKHTALFTPKKLYRVPLQTLRLNESQIVSAARFGTK